MAPRSKLAACRDVLTRRFAAVVMRRIGTDGFVDPCIPTLAAKAARRRQLFAPGGTGVGGGARRMRPPSLIVAGFLSRERWKRREHPL
jgi:hypothetical protein